MVDLSVKLKDLELKNPVTTASGTFGFGEEFDDFIDLNKLGGIFVKGLTLHHREGNPYPRMAETPSGMLNAVGLQNKGIDYFMSDIYPRIKHLDTEIIPNVNGSTIEDYIEVTEKINEIEGINAIELNISCPNVKEGGMAFGVSCPSANAVSLVNTILAMAIDAKTRKPILSTITGGLSGPAIKPIALRMVWQVYNAVRIPVSGMGGIMNATDAIEFMLAGASTIQVGTANFIDPTISIQIIDGIERYCEENGFSAARELVGTLEV